jgi:hypothetical protein
MAYFSAYFDESTGPGSPLVAVSGYIAEDEKWDEFAERWDEVVQRERVSAIHWTELETFHGEFTRDRGWDEARKLRVQKELIPIIKETIGFGVCITINVSDHDTHLQEIGRTAYETAYVYAVRMAIALTAHESKRRGWMESTAYLIERSNERHKKELRKAFSYVFDESDLATNPANKNRLGSLTTDANRIANVPLQAADVIAYETWKDADPKEKVRRRGRRRASFKSLLEVPHLYTHLNALALNKMASDRELEAGFLMP